MKINKKIIYRFSRRHNGILYENKSKTNIFYRLFESLRDTRL